MSLLKKLALATASVAVISAMAAPAMADNIRVSMKKGPRRKRGPFGKGRRQTEGRYSCHRSHPSFR